MDVLRVDAEADVDPAREPVSLGSALDDLFSKWGR
jgi:hypothetical protein